MWRSLASSLGSKQNLSWAPHISQRHISHPALGQNIMPSPTEGFAEALADG